MLLFISTHRYKLYSLQLYLHHSWLGMSVRYSRTLSLLFYVGGDCLICINLIMPYERIPGFEGLFYVPPKADNESKKHPCPDCFVCQWCGDSRCVSCRGSCNDGKRKDHAASACGKTGK